MRYKSYTLSNYREIPQVSRLSEEQKFTIDVVARVLPFKVNNYTVNELLKWDDLENDPLFTLSFPQKEMLRPEHFKEIADLLIRGADKGEIVAAANKIRMQLNPHPAGQLNHNVPQLESHKLFGMQHKYRETVLFFPSHGQTCHAYCTFCFRWPQFVGMDGLKFSSRDVELLIEYLLRHPAVTDVLFTGGDPLVMKASHLAAYLYPLLKADLPNLQNIRIGTKALASWPYRFLTDADAEDLLELFREVRHSGKHLAIMAHYNHYAELETEAAKQAIDRVLETGAQIRTQSPLLKHINADPEVWAENWRRQVKLGCVPYYMFVVRDTGAQRFFAVPLVRAWQIFRAAYDQVSGLCRTVRGPSMSAGPGKVRVSGVTEIRGEKVLMLEFIQGRDPAWVSRPFFAEYDEEAIWLSDLKPALGEPQFFFEGKHHEHRGA
jgi:KamA family protein